MVSTQTSLTCSKADNLLPQSLLYNIITSKLAEAFEMTNLHALLCDYSDNLSNIKREPDMPRYSFTSNFPNEPHFDLQIPSDSPQGCFSPEKYRPRKRQRLNSFRSPPPSMSLHETVGLMPVEKINHKYICKNCDKVYASAKWLSNHLEKCDRIIYKKSLTETCKELTHETPSTSFIEDSRVPVCHEEMENEAHVKKTYKVIDDEVQIEIDNDVQYVKSISVPEKRDEISKPAPSMSLHEIVGLMPVEKINHSKYICKNCDKVYTSAKWLSNHLEKCSKNLIYQKSITESCKELTDDTSSSSFIQGSKVNVSHQGEIENLAQALNDAKNEIQNKIDTDHKYNCKNCGKVYASAKWLSNHLEKCDRIIYKKSLPESCKELTDETPSTSFIEDSRVPVSHHEEMENLAQALNDVKNEIQTMSYRLRDTDYEVQTTKSISGPEKRDQVISKPESDEISKPDISKAKKKGKLIRFSLEKETSDAEEEEVIMCYLIDKTTEPRPLQPQVKPTPLQLENKPVPMHPQVKPTLLQLQIKPMSLQSQVKPMPLQSQVQPKPLQPQTEPMTVQPESELNPVQSETIPDHETDLMAEKTPSQVEPDVWEIQTSPSKSADSDADDKTFKPPPGWKLESAESSEMGQRDDFVRRSTRVRTKRVFRKKFNMLITRRKQRQGRRGRPKKQCILPTEQPSSSSNQIVNHTASTSTEPEYCCSFCMCRFQSLWKSRRHEYTVHGVGTPLTSDDLESRQCGTDCAACQRKGLPCGPDSGEGGPLSPTKMGQDEDSMWVCGICGENLRRKAYLIEHKAVHVTERLPVPNDKDMYTCKVCDKEFQTDVSLMNHVNKKHNPSQTCSLCYKVFTSHLALNSHSCTSDVTISCRHCPKMFKSHSDHIKHVNSAHSSLTHAFDQSACRLCDYTFSSALKFKVHQSISHPSHDMICLLCDTSHESRDQLVSHVREVHNMMPFLCTVCEEGFQCCEEMVRHKTGHFS